MLRWFSARRSLGADAQPDLAMDLLLHSRSQAERHGRESQSLLQEPLRIARRRTGDESIRRPERV